MSWALLEEAARFGVRLFRSGDDVAYEAPQHPPAALLARLRAHRDELLATLGGDARAEDWIVSSTSDGDMRLVVATGPPWPDAVFEAAALIEVLDDRHRADRADAQEIADRLKVLLDGLRASGIEAWLTS